MADSFAPCQCTWCYPKKICLVLNCEKAREHFIDPEKGIQALRQLDFFLNIFSWERKSCTPSWQQRRRISVELHDIDAFHEFRKPGQAPPQENKAWSWTEVPFLIKVEPCGSSCLGTATPSYTRSLFLLPTHFYWASGPHIGLFHPNVFAIYGDRGEWSFFFFFLLKSPYHSLV